MRTVGAHLVLSRRICDLMEIEIKIAFWLKSIKLRHNIAKSIRIAVDMLGFTCDGQYRVNTICDIKSILVQFLHNMQP